MKYITIIVMTFSLLIPNCLSANTSDYKDEKIQPRDVYALLESIGKDLDLINEAMGYPELKGLEINIKDAAPREVIFQALTLYKNANELNYEFSGEYELAPKIPEKNIVPADVYRIVQKSQQHISKVKKFLKIKKENPIEVVTEDITPSQVFMLMVKNNRKINMLVEKPITYSDVYQQVVLAINYTAQILESKNEFFTIPILETEDELKKTSDVLNEFMSSFELLKKIAANNSLKILSIETKDDYNTKNLRPRQLYDIATLLVSEVAYLNKVMVKNPEKVSSYFPGKKYPNDIYYKSLVLKEQLEKLNN